MSRPTKPALATPDWLRGSLLRFVVVFALLIIPWPGFDELYGSYFRAMGTSIFSSDGSNRFVQFDRQILRHDFTAVNTTMTIGNRDLADASGHGLARQNPLNTRSIGWIPTALTISLIASSPLSWQRKASALVAGLVLVHGLILFSLQTLIWSEAGAVSLAHPSPFWQDVADGLRYTFVTQLGVSFTAPVLIWLLVCFRRSDMALIFRPAPRK